jgi:hypothetical protein
MANNLPEQIKYLIKNIQDKKVPVYNRQAYMGQLTDIYLEIEKTLKAYQLELYDYKEHHKKSS